MSLHIKCKVSIQDRNKIEFWGCFFAVVPCTPSYMCVKPYNPTHWHQHCLLQVFHWKNEHKMMVTDQLMTLLIKSHISQVKLSTLSHLFQFIIQLSMAAALKNDLLFIYFSSIYPAYTILCFPELWFMSLVYDTIRNTNKKSKNKLMLLWFFLPPPPKNGSTPQFGKHDTLVSLFSWNNFLWWSISHNKQAGLVKKGFYL